MKTIVFTLALTGVLLSARAQLKTAAQAQDNGFTGRVLETTNAAGYTYVLVDTGTKKSWAATTQFAVQPGDTVTVSPGMTMTNYHSRTLNRDFDGVYFTGSITVAGSSETTSASGLPPGHPAISGEMGGKKNPAPKPPKVDLTGIQPAKDGMTVQQIIDGKSRLDGQTVTVRGKVVKYNGGILGKNWLHLQDGSGAADKANHDLTVTTATEARVGDTVLVTGKLSLNKDFGAGYKYAVILDDAQVTVE